MMALKSDHSDPFLRPKTFIAAVMTKIASDSASPIFIVGPPRSGTSLLSAIIGSHSRIACGPETDLFECVPVEDATRISSERNWIDQATARLDSILYPDGKTLLSHFGLSVGSLTAFLSTQERSPQSIYAAIPATFAGNHGKVRWAEKTPRHILYVDAIRDLYPEAKIIRIVRDPRDAIPSVVKNIGLSKSLIGEFYRWMAVYEFSAPFFQRDSGSITVRYEDLVMNPAGEVASLCEFIGEKYEPTMLQRSGADHVRVATETWKVDIDKQITADNIYAWQNRLESDVAKAASLICYEAIKEFAYPRGIAPEQDLSVFPLGVNFGVANESHVIRCANNRVRYKAAPRPYPSSIDEALGCYQGALIGDLPLGKLPVIRIWNSAKAVGYIILRFVRGNPVKVDPEIQLGIGTLSRIVRKFALLFGNKTSMG